jgi:hypothetical protein
MHRAYNSSDPASSDPANGQFLVDNDFTHLTTIIEVSDLDSGASTNSSASLNDVSASWTASFSHATAPH